jgi:hypothetical protein
VIAHVAVVRLESRAYNSPGRIGKFVDNNGNTVTDRSETFIYDGAGLLCPLPRFGGEGQGEGASAIRIPGVNGALGQYGWVDDVVLVYSDTDGYGPASSTLTARNLYGPLVDQIFVCHFSQRPFQTGGTDDTCGSRNAVKMEETRADSGFCSGDCGSGLRSVIKWNEHSHTSVTTAVRVGEIIPAPQR